MRFFYNFWNRNWELLVALIIAIVGIFILFKAVNEAANTHF